jgi:peptidoglycan/LPS O-acetylase OafA/YrhL
MLASLNSLRVIAEFWVVHHHITLSHPVINAFVWDLMSFFFVLSGFVLTHTHQHNDLSTWAARRAFWWRRWSKTYPVYFMFWAITLVLSLALHSKSHVPTCCWLQLVCFDGWVLCDFLDLYNAVSWYISALAWAWLGFPWLLPALSRAASTVGPWILMACLWVMALGINTAMLSQGILRGYSYPGLRILEFAIGCLAATTIHTRLHWLLAVGPALLLTAGYATMFSFSLGRDDAYAHTEFHWAAPDSFGTTYKWYTAFVTKTALVWAALIQYLAASERLHLPHWLSGTLRDSPTLRTLSDFSLQLYLGHQTLHMVAKDLSRVTIGPLGLHLLFLVVYGSCYLVYVYVQPLLDRGAQALGNGVAQWAPLSRGATPPPSPPPSDGPEQAPGC